MEWEILKLIGCGSYGSVHLVRNCKTMELAALKTSKCFEDGHLVIGALRELFFYSSFFPSPGVCSSLGHWKVGDTLYILLPLYPCTMEDVYIQFQNTLPFNDFIRLLRDSVTGLKSMHNQAYLHRDIKPENILVSKEGACLTDFNLMRWAAFYKTSENSATSPKTIVPDKETIVSCAPSFCFRNSTETRSACVKSPSSQLKDNASSLVCTLWTRAPELVRALLQNEKSRVSYGSEIDIFSLGSSLFALAAGDFILGKKCSLEKVKLGAASSLDTTDDEKKVQNTKEYRYLGGFLKTFGISKEITDFYGTDFASHRQWETAPSAIYEFIKHQLLWSTEQLVSVSILLAKMLHPIPSQRTTLCHIEKWLNKYSHIPSTFSQTFQLFLMRKQGKMLEKIPRVCAKLLQPHPQPPMDMQDFDAREFWSLCSASFIPPYIACEVLRIKQTMPLSLQYSKALLYLFDCMHEFQQAENYKLMAGVDVENVFALACIIKPSKETIYMALSLYTTPFLLCCLAAELYVSGKLCSAEELKKSKTMNLSNVKPFFEAYGNNWKSQITLLQTWNRLL